MSDAAALAHAEPETNTGIENKKLIMWLFLASDCMFFGTLISTHLIYRKLYPVGHFEEGVVAITSTFDIELTSFSTFILLMSSFLMALAVSAMHKGQIKSFRNNVIGVIIFGLIFLGGQVYEFQHFMAGKAKYEYVATDTGGVEHQGEKYDVADKQDAQKYFEKKHPDWTITEFKQSEVVFPAMTLQNSLFGSTFFVLTGTHGCHVAIGIIWLLSMYFFSFTGRMDAGSAMDVEIAGLYWHFVDIVWIVIFTAVYLVEYI
ncbi:MAG: heme-copper oxidase subunit III [Verrucomicrobiota bacterium]